MRNTCLISTNTFLIKEQTKIKSNTNTCLVDHWKKKFTNEQVNMMRSEQNKDI
jgi:hypothetical protein